VEVENQRWRPFTGSRYGIRVYQPADQVAMTFQKLPHVFGFQKQDGTHVQIVHCTGRQAVENPERKDQPCLYIVKCDKTDYLTSLHYNYGIEQ